MHRWFGAVMSAKNKAMHTCMVVFVGCGCAQWGQSLVGPCGRGRTGRLGMWRDVLHYRNMPRCRADQLSRSLGERSRRRRGIPCCVGRCQIALHIYGPLFSSLPPPTVLDTSSPKSSILLELTTIQDHTHPYACFVFLKCRATIYTKPAIGCWSWRETRSPLPFCSPFHPSLDDIHHHPSNQ